MEPRRIAYLASEYPGISHTFIFREIQALRKAGHIIETASIRKASRGERLSGVEREDAARTLNIIDRGAAGALVDNLGLYLTDPGAGLKMLARVFGLFAAGKVGLGKGLSLIHI